MLFSLTQALAVRAGPHAVQAFAVAGSSTTSFSSYQSANRKLESTMAHPSRGSGRERSSLATLLTGVVLGVTATLLILQLRDFSNSGGMKSYWK